MHIIRVSMFLYLNRSGSGIAGCIPSTPNYLSHDQEGTVNKIDGSYTYVLSID